MSESKVHLRNHWKWSLAFKFTWPLKRLWRSQRLTATLCNCFSSSHIVGRWRIPLESGVLKLKYGGNVITSQKIYAKTLLCIDSKATSLYLSPLTAIYSKVLIGRTTDKWHCVFEAGYHPPSVLSELLSRCMHDFIFGTRFTLRIYILLQCSKLVMKIPPHVISRQLPSVALSRLGLHGSLWLYRDMPWQRVVKANSCTKRMADVYRLISTTQTKQLVGSQLSLVVLRTPTWTYETYGISCLLTSLHANSATATLQTPQSLFHNEGSGRCELPHWVMIYLEIRALVWDMLQRYKLIMDLEIWSTTTYFHTHQRFTWTPSSWAPQMHNALPKYCESFWNTRCGIKSALYIKKDSTPASPLMNHNYSMHKSQYSLKKNRIWLTLPKVLYSMCPNQGCSCNCGRNM